MAVKHTFKVLDKLITKSLTRSAAIKEFCLDCSGGARTERRDCNIITCPLFPYRTGSVDPSFISGKRKWTADQKKAASDRMKKLHKSGKLKGD